MSGGYLCLELNCFKPIVVDYTFPFWPVNHPASNIGRHGLPGGQPLDTLTFGQLQAAC